MLGPTEGWALVPSPALQEPGLHGLLQGPEVGQRGRRALGRSLGAVVTPGMWAGKAAGECSTLPSSGPLAEDTVTGCCRDRWPRSISHPSLWTLRSRYRPQPWLGKFGHLGSCVQRRDASSGRTASLQRTVHHAPHSKTDLALQPGRSLWNGSLSPAPEAET